MNTWPFKCLVFAGLGVFFQAVAFGEDIVWQDLPEIYPGELSLVSIQATNEVDLEIASITVSNTTGDVSTQNGLPFGRDVLCGKHVLTLFPVTADGAPQSSFLVPGTYFIRVEMGSRTNYFRQVMRPRGHPLKVPIKTKVPCTGFPSPHCFFFG